jgi:hypothetical protein
MKNIVLEIVGRLVYFALGFVFCLFLISKGIL